MGLYSTSKDLAKLARSILSHTLLSESAVNAWLKPAAFTASPHNAVGAPWEIYTPYHLAHSSRPTEIYAKSGGVPGYGAFVALIPEYNVGITINAAGDDSVIANRYLLDLVVQDLVPRLEALTRHQAMQKYAGQYTSTEGDAEDSISIIIDDGPGLRVTDWTSNGASMFATWSAVAGAPLRDSSTRDPDLVPEVRAYPVGEDDRWQISFSTSQARGIFGLSCEEWLNVAAFQYAGLPVDELVFEVDGGRIRGLQVPGTRQVLKKV